ncbi:ComF family protein [Vreelandella lutescens]|uniref:ComF family protein n=1 Tax=Vreelandella lutescens TaxID=1602943 RepID=UPI0016661F01|nr:ComF family protein [Halomonas lutescens]
MHKWTQAVSQWFKQGLPGYCAFCLTARAFHAGWCDECFAQLPWNHRRCEQCAEPLVGQAGQRCGHCLVEPPSFTATTAALCYQGPVTSLVHDFKFHGSPRAGMLLVELMLSRRPAQVGDALLAVPMYPARAKARGFNQAQWLAERLGERIHKPLLQARCVKHLPSQRALNRRERQQNLLGAFTVKSPVPAHVTIIDDVVTTGATGHALASVLLVNGAQRVDIWAAARTPLQKS